MSWSIYFFDVFFYIDQPSDDLLADLPNEESSDLLGSGAKKDTDSNMDLHSSELYMFGDKDELLNALNEDPSWSAVTQSMLTTSDNAIGRRESAYTTFDFSQNRNDVRSMEVEDDFDLPSLPGIPDSTFNTQQTNRTNLGIDTQLDQFGDSNTQGLYSPIMIDSDTVPDVEEFLSTTLSENRDSLTTSSHAQKDVFSRRMESLGLEDDSPVVISSSATTPTSTSTPSYVTAPSPSILSPAPATPKPSGPRVTLRKRRAIQMKPFTLEKSHFQKLIGRTSANSKLRGIENIRPNLDDDDSDNDFIPSNTQAIDEPLDEISSTQSALELADAAQSNKKKTKKKANPQVPPPTPQTTSSSSIAPTRIISTMKVAQSSTSRQLVASTSRPPLLMELSSEATTPLNDISVDYSQDLLKYGLDKLILPPSRKEREKQTSKVITFSTKKKGSRRKQTSTSSTRLKKEPAMTQDIFAFDLYPRASLNHQPITIHDDSDSTERGPTPNYVSASLPHGTDDEMNEGNEDEEEEEEGLVIRRRPAKRKRRLGFDSDDDEEEGDTSEEEVEQLTEEQIDAIYTYPPAASETPSRRHHLVTNEEDKIVPIIDDEYEYRENKRQRMSIKDIKKKALKRVLPASFYTIHKKDFLEEQQRKRQAASNRKRPNKAVAQPPTLSTTGSTSNNTAPSSTAKKRGLEDVFASLQESQSEDSDDGFDKDDHNDEDNHDNFFSDGYDDYDGGFDDINFDRTMLDSSNSSSPDHSQASNTNQHDNPPLAPIFRNVRRTGSSSSNTILKPSSTSNTRNNPSATSNSRHIPNSPYPLEEATEDNRVPRQHVRSSTTSGANNATQPRSRASRRNRANNTRSSIAIVRPANMNSPHQNWIQIIHNPTPVRRRKRPKRSTDDIYVHAPYFTGQYNTYISQQRQHDGGEGTESRYDRLMSIGDFLPRKAFDDIFMGTKQQALMYKNHPIYIGNYNIDDYLYEMPRQRQQQQQQEGNWTPSISSLQNVIKRVRGLLDHDLRRVMGLDNTVYLHHRLFEPLLSATPNTSRVYSKFKETYAELRLFGRLYLWQHIQPHEKDTIHNFFAKVFRDLLHLCSSNGRTRPTLEEEHDYFYIFVSICLTQWIPHLAYEAQVQLAEMFANSIRGLAYMVNQLAEKQAKKDLSWRSLIKMMLFILDWTCRLHHLGIARSLWSVTECTQLIMDMLVSMGYQAIRNTTKPFVVEAWICLIQIMSVSTRQGGYYLNEQVFLNQLTDSIQRKSKDTESYEFEKRKTTRIWAEHLDYILDKYIILL